jgi:hypothetical protein
MALPQPGRFRDARLSNGPQAALVHELYGGLQDFGADVGPPAAFGGCGSGCSHGTWLDYQTSW